MIPINCIPIDQYYHKKVRNQENSLKISNFIVSDSQQNKSSDPNINLNNKQNKLKKKKDIQENEKGSSQLMKRINKIKNDKIEESQSYSVQNEQISSFSRGEQSKGKKLKKTQNKQ